MKKLFACMTALFLCLPGIAQDKPKAPKAAEKQEKTTSSSWLKGHFGKELVDLQKRPVDVKTLQGKFIGIYFSAHWCPPCRAFTPKLVEFRNKLVQSGKNFEIVFVSCDKNKKAMFEYMTTMQMPWPAVPFKDEHVAMLEKAYNVTGIPALMILSPEGDLLTTEGRLDIMQLEEKAFTKWKKASKAILQ